MLKLTVPLPRLLGPGEVVAGEGSLAALRALPAARVALIATDRAIAAAPMERWLSGTHRFHLQRFAPSWTGEPSLSAMQGTLSAISDYRPDWIVAVGGGSVLDGAKLCWALYEHPQFPLERLARPFALPPLRAAARFVAIPTTSGTGSECSSSAVLADSDTGVKIPVVTHDFLPDIAILEPRLTHGLPLEWTAISGFDALAHALEGRLSKLVNPLVTGIAENAVAELLAGLDAYAQRGEDAAVRASLQTASFFAGQVQNLKLVGLAHLIAHQFGSPRLPHGLLVATFLPASLRHACRDAFARRDLDRIASRCGFADADGLIRALENLRAALGISDHLREWGGAANSAFSSADARRIAERAVADPLARYLPVPITEQEVYELAIGAW